MRQSTVLGRVGTPADLIDAAALGARIAARIYRYEGCDGDSVRRAVVEHYRKVLSSEYHDIRESETLMAAVQRAVEAVLDEPDTGSAEF